MKFLITLLINVVLAVWVHNDAKKFRAKGISVTPGLWSTLVFLGSVPLFIIYLLLRVLKLSKKLEISGPQALPPAPAWTNWLTIIILAVIAVVIIAIFNFL